MSMNLAEKLEQNEEFEKAYEEYKKIRAQRPKSVEILERLGHLAVILNKNEEAEEYYSKIIEFDPENTMAHEQLMDIYFHTDRYKYYVSRGNLHVVQQELNHAISDFKKALDKTQKDEEIATIRFMLANLYEQTGKSHQAIDEYLRIMDTSAANEMVYLKLAKIYYSQDALPSAIEILQRAIERGFDSSDVKETMAQLYLANNQPEKARDFTQNDLLKVKSLLDQGENQKAFDVLENIDNKYKKDAQYYSLLAQYYFNTKNWEKSLECVEEFGKIEKNSSLTYQMRAFIYEEKGNEFDSHINWAKYNLARKDKDVALNEYMLAYQVKDYDGTLIKNIAELLDDLNDRMHAAEFWEKLVKIEPANKKALERVAEFKDSIGDYRAKAETLEQLYSIDRRNAIVIKNLAETYEKLRKKNKALEYYNKFLTVSPVSEEGEKIQTKIKKLESTEMEEDEGLIGKIMGFFSKK